MSDILESGPIPYLSADTGVVRDEPIDSASGSTCLCFRHFDGGQVWFKKQLKAELCHDEQYRMAFRKEFELGHSLENIYFPHYESLHEEGDCVYILMENIEGCTLEEKIQQEPEFFHKTENLKRFLNQLAEALGYLHRHQVVFSDLQPRNIMLTRVNNDVRIVDFGFTYADSFQASVGTTSGFASGDKQVDARNDVYSFGCIIRYIHQKSGMLLSRDMTYVVRGCTEKKPENRFQNMSEVMSALKGRPWYRKGVYQMTVALVLVLAGVSAWIFWPEKGYDFAIFSQYHTVYFKILDAEKGWVEVVNPDTTNMYAGSLTIPEKVEYNNREYTVTRISDGCFYKNPKLQIVTLPTTIRTIGPAAFNLCSELESITLHEGLDSIYSGALWNCHSIRNIKLPSTLCYLGAAALFNLSITSIEIPKGIKVLTRDVLCCDSFLVDVRLPEGIVAIERGVFWSCVRLPEITIPSTVKEIGELAFASCPKLKHVYCLPLNPPSGVDMFDEDTGLTIHVPAKALDAYRKDTYWGKFNLVPINE